MVDSNQVVLNSGGDQYQTVTIVPSDGQGGEVSCRVVDLAFVATPLQFVKTRSRNLNLESPQCNYKYLVACYKLLYRRRGRGALTLPLRYDPPSFKNLKIDALLLC